MSESAPNENKKTKNPTIRDVSRLAGVSTATVSRILANYDVVSDETRQKVNDAIRQLNFKVNRNARNLRKSKSSKIGVLITDVQNPFFGSIVRGIEKGVSDRDYTLILGNSDENVEREKKILDSFLEEGVAGIVLVPASSESDPYRALLSLRVPFVVVDRKISSISADSVCVDSYAGAKSAVETFLQMGHQNIALISGLPHLSVMQERKKGFKDAFLLKGLPVDETLIHHANNRYDGGCKAMQELLSLPNKPTAVLISNNLMTLGGLEAIHQSGYRIPEDISLIGFDDMEWASCLQPPLSVIAQPAFEMGERAAKLLVERILEPNLPPRKIVLDTNLIMRSSCKLLKS